MSMLRQYRWFDMDKLSPESKSKILTLASVVQTDLRAQGKATLYRRIHSLIWRQGFEWSSFELRIKCIVLAMSCINILHEAHWLRPRGSMRDPMSKMASGLQEELLPGPRPQKSVSPSEYTGDDCKPSSMLQTILSLCRRSWPWQRWVFTGCACSYDGSEAMDTFNSVAVVVVFVFAEVWERWYLSLLACFP